MEAPNGPDDTSWWDELIGRSTDKQSDAPPPPTPQPPPVNQSAWEKSVEQAKVQDETVHDVGLRIFQETKSFSDRLDENEPLDAARQKLAWTIYNGYDKWGADRQIHARTALPIEPPAQELRDPSLLAAYQSSMKAAREAYLGWKDPTYGALHFHARTDPGQYPWKPEGMKGPGMTVKTHSGPYNNSFTKGDTPYTTVWLNTYEDK